MGKCIGENCIGIIGTFETKVSHVGSVDPLLLAYSQISKIRWDSVPEMVFFCKLGVLLVVSCSWQMWVSLIRNIFAATKVEIDFRHDIYTH